MIQNSYQEKFNQYFRCYNCQKYFLTKNSKTDIKTQNNLSKENKCKFCFSKFIEKITEEEMLKKQKIVIPQYTISQDKTNQNIQLIRKKIKFRNNDPFVRDILKPQFPDIFKKKKNNVLSHFQSTVSTINIFELDLSKNGPTDQEFIKKLKKIKFTNLKNPNKSCSICTDIFLTQIKVIQLPCQHVFHKYCIIPWLELNNSCPICRRNFPAKRIIQLQQIEYNNV